MRHRWTGWRDNALVFESPEGERIVESDAIVLALGGASWPRLGSTGEWVGLLEQRAVAVAPLVASNCGFDVDWSEHFASRHAGAPLATVAIGYVGRNGECARRQGQFVVTQTGIEGSLVYALSAVLRDQIAASGSTTIWLDLAPHLIPVPVLVEVTSPRAKLSMTCHKQIRVGIKGVKAGLLRECLDAPAYADPARLAQAIKALPLALKRTRPVEEAISSGGGVRFDALDDQLMLRALPGMFVAGEMVDWEAPTGGYLLTACFASGRVAGRGALDWISRGS
jgi:uncharacterized flavoprotein (TIGR03862 family)